MTASDSSPKSSNGHSPEDAATFLRGMAYGRLQAEVDSLKGMVLELHRAVSLVMETQQATLTMFATLQSETKTACSTETKRSTATPFSMLSRVTRKLARHFTPEIALFLFTRFVKYGAAAVLTAGGAMSAWFRWLEPLLRALLG